MFLALPAYYVGQGLCNGMVSVCLSIGRFAAVGHWAWQVGDIDRLLHSRHRSGMGLQHGAQQQMRAVSRLQLM